MQEKPSSLLIILINRFWTSFNIYKCSPFFSMSCKSFHKAGIAVFTSMRADYFFHPYKIFLHPHETIQTRHLLYSDNGNLLWYKSPVLWKTDLPNQDRQIHFYHHNDNHGNSFCMDLFYYFSLHMYDMAVGTYGMLSANKDSIKLAVLLYRYVIFLW